MFGRTAHLESQIAHLRDRLDRQEALLTALAAQAGLDPAAVRAAGVEDSMPAPVLDALRRRQMILAIKEYRTATGAGLAEAKRAVEEYAAAHGY
ncbi:hypothetical protein BF93_16700 [Brachybacterium phenoliresistens]|uniref:50S ribosomal protein L7/L12 n=1 Tax=Brachybacterium phenoliresistens TaxID=396014 RepID=Z9JT52_9MICO|nr:hypothetical protein [Brachybacterium phenoliresistens]EWS81515.1 hypothetical protein BF93_16700 [Brachybacterium phenoliresistens]